MTEKLQKRLEELRKEFETGQKMLSDLETQQTQLKSSLLRISGAIQVLEELLSQAQTENRLEEIAATETIKAPAM